MITPVGINVINLGYSHLVGNLDLNGAVPITGATATANLAAFGYYRALDFFGRSTNFALAIPYGVGDFSGTVADAPKHARRSGLLDSSLRFSVNLIGGPAMEPKEFVNWRQDVLLGVSLKIVAPTGLIRRPISEARASASLHPFRSPSITPSRLVSTKATMSATAATTEP